MLCLRKENMSIRTTLPATEVRKNFFDIIDKIRKEIVIENNLIFFFFDSHLRSNNSHFTNPASHHNEI